MAREASGRWLGHSIRAYVLLAVPTTISLSDQNTKKSVFGIQNVVTTASRPETIEGAKKSGATHTISHREPLVPQLE